MADFQVGEHHYRSGKIDAMTQFHMVARLTPIAAALVNARSALEAASAPAGEDGKDGEEKGATSRALDLAAIAMPAATAIAGMSDKDREYIIGKCFAVTHRRQGTAEQPHWAPLWSKSGNVMAFHDINCFEMLMIAQQVIQDNLGGFFPGNPFALKGA